MNGVLENLEGWIVYAISAVLLPIITIGTIRKTKARMQNRKGLPLFQLLYDVLKLCKKGETISSTMTWLFRSSAAINFASMLLLATLIPWLSFKPACAGADLFLVIYLFALGRFFTMLAALDAGSAFGAFGASREATLSVLIEPASVLSLVALGLVSQTSDLNTIFSFQNAAVLDDIGIWILAGTAILFASLVELSRMPIDDPTTHLELTMVHEAMILESSGRNLALTECAHALRMSVMFGLSAQCYMRAVPAVWQMDAMSQGAISVAVLLIIAFGVGLFESAAVKLQWLKAPEFIAYSLTMSLLAGLMAVGEGIVK